MKKENTQNLTHDNVPATVGLVKEVREELRSEIRSVDHKVDSLEHKLEAVRSELKASIEDLKVSVHRTQVLMEEQRGENKIVLDGIKTLIERQDRLEAKIA